MFVFGFASGLLLGVGIMLLDFAYDFSSLLHAELIDFFYYAGFGLIIFGIILAVYEFASIRKTVERVKSGRTSLQ
jgi:multisubunit Na+/H+ antiporter MnhB subunit